MKIDHVRACQMPFSGRKIPRLAKQRDDYEKIGGVSGIIVRYGQIWCGFRDKIGCRVKTEFRIPYCPALSDRYHDFACDSL